MKRIILLTSLLLLIALPATVQAQTLSSEEKAKKAFASGNYSDAQKLFTAAAAVNAANKEKADQLRQQASIAQNAARLQEEAHTLWGKDEKSSAAAKYRELIKLNPDDAIARQRIKEVKTEVQYAKMMEQAVYWYAKGEYQQAVACFNKAGASTSWTKAQLDAFRHASEEVGYAAFKNAATQSEREKAGEQFVKQYPSSEHTTEVKDWLYDYLYAGRYYYLALQYATTEERAQRARKADKRKSAGSNVGDFFNAINIFKNMHPALGLGLEARLLGDMNEGAIPLSLWLYDTKKPFNVAIGVRGALRGNYNSDCTYDTIPNTNNVQRHAYQIQYYQLSPYVHVFYSFGDGREGYFIGAFARYNYNWGFTFSDEFATSYNGSFYTDDYNRTVDEYSPDDVLSKSSFTFGFEAGISLGEIEAYLYYSIDALPPISEAKVQSIANDPSNDLYQGVVRSEIGSYMTKKGYLGVGLRLVF